MQTSDELLIGTTEAAAILGVNRVTVLRWAGDGLLPYVRKLPGSNGAVLFSAVIVRRKAAERLLQRKPSTSVTEIERTSGRAS